MIRDSAKTVRDMHGYGGYGSTCEGRGERCVSKGQGTPPVSIIAEKRDGSNSGVGEGQSSAEYRRGSWTDRPPAAAVRSDTKLGREHRETGDGEGSDVGKEPDACQTCGTAREGGATLVKPGGEHRERGVRGDGEKDRHPPKCSDKRATVTGEVQLEFGVQVRFEPEDMSKRQRARYRGTHLVRGRREDVAAKK